MFFLFLGAKNNANLARNFLIFQYDSKQSKHFGTILEKISCGVITVFNKGEILTSSGFISRQSIFISDKKVYLGIAKNRLLRISDLDNYDIREAIATYYEKFWMSVMV